WKTIGTPTDGKVTKELLPIQYLFRMTFELSTQEKWYTVSAANSELVFETVNMTISLKKVNKELIPNPSGLVEYNVGGWKTIGTPTDGKVTKELLPIQYLFRMTLEGSKQEKWYTVSAANSELVFETVNVTFSVTKNNNSLTGSEVQYNVSGWTTIGSTDLNGTVTKELLPIQYLFRASNGGTWQEKWATITAATPTVSFAF
ncbi:MAG: hypothetical protein HXX20_08905, partial [Chloroflexi bacterium]|nr:hypothetical protein [Chloroflexota bacterium]